MAQLDTGLSTGAAASSGDVNWLELTFSTPKQQQAQQQQPSQHQWSDTLALEQLASFQAPAGRERVDQQSTESLGSLLSPGSPPPAAASEPWRPATDVKLWEGTAQSSGVERARARAFGEANAKAWSPAQPARAPPRIVDLSAPSLEQTHGAVGASPLRLLRRPEGESAVTVQGGAGDNGEGAPLSREAQVLHAYLQASIAAVELRLQQALSEALRESTNLRLSFQPPDGAAAPTTSWRHVAAEDAAVAAAVHVDPLPRPANASMPLPASRIAVALSPFKASDTDEQCLVRAEADDPFVVLLTWAADRPARLADVFGEAAAVSDTFPGISRIAVNRLIADTLVPGIDAHGLRYINLVLDCCSAAQQTGDIETEATAASVTAPAFVAAIREGATAGAAARATFHAPMAEVMDRLARSLDTYTEAWAFHSRVHSSGAFTAAQLVRTAQQVMPGGMLPRHRVLLAAAVHADAAFGGPRHRFTLQQVRQLCVPRHDRVAARKRAAAARAAFEGGDSAARSPYLETPFHRKPPPPLLMIQKPEHAHGSSADAVLAAERAALHQFAVALAGFGEREVPAVQKLPPPPSPPPSQHVKPPVPVHPAPAAAPPLAESAHSAPKNVHSHRAMPAKQAHVDTAAWTTYTLPPQGEIKLHSVLDAAAHVSLGPQELRRSRSTSGGMAVKPSRHDTALAKLRAVADAAAKLSHEAVAVRGDIKHSLQAASHMGAKLKGPVTWHP